MKGLRSVPVVCSLLLAALAFRPSPGARADEGGRYWVFVGTYTGAGSQGIYRFVFDPGTGRLTDRQLAAETPNPSFLAIHPDGRALYAVNEVSEFDGKPAGSVSAFGLGPRDGRLIPLNRQTSGGPGPCHINVDQLGGYVLFANYGGGSAGVLSLQTDGSLGVATAFVQHRGKSADPGRQEAPHAHSINLDPNNRFAVVADLGLDKVFVYRFDPTKGTLTPNDPPFAAVEPGSGPRHFAFHPNGRNAYVINEMTCTVTAFDYDAERGTLKAIQTISTLPRPRRPGDSTAEIRVHPSGRFVYGSNRGHNSIAVFACDPETGKLTHRGNQSQGIKTPRNFAIDPTGKFLLVANQDGHDIAVFRIDAESGALTPVGGKAEVPSPVCLRFVAIAP